MNASNPTLPGATVIEGAPGFGKSPSALKFIGDEGDCLAAGETLGSPAARTARGPSAKNCGWLADADGHIDGRG